MTKPTHIYLIEPVKPNLSSQIYQTKPSKPSLPNHTYQNNSTKPNLQNQTYQTKPTKPNQDFQRNKSKHGGSCCKSEICYISYQVSRNQMNDFQQSSFFNPEK